MSDQQLDATGEMININKMNFAVVVNNRYVGLQ